MTAITSIQARERASLRGQKSRSKLEEGVGSDWPTGPALLVFEDQSAKPEERHAADPHGFHCEDPHGGAADDVHIFASDAVGDVAAERNGDRRKADCREYTRQQKIARSGCGCVNPERTLSAYPTLSTRAA